MKLAEESAMKREEIEEILASPIPWADETDEKRSEVGCLLALHHA